jgi:hypothetical protein
MLLINTFQQKLFTPFIKTHDVIDQDKIFVSCKTAGDDSRQEDSGKKAPNTLIRRRCWWVTIKRLRGIWCETTDGSGWVQTWEGEREDPCTGHPVSASNALFGLVWCT